VNRVPLTAGRLLALLVAVDEDTPISALFDAGFAGGEVMEARLEDGWIVLVIE
jgi:hypothetical protein